MKKQDKEYWFQTTEDGPAITVDGWTPEDLVLVVDEEGRNVYLFASSKEYSMDIPMERDYRFPEIPAPLNHFIALPKQKRVTKARKRRRPANAGRKAA